MKYISTRDCTIEFTSSQAIIHGLAPDGGLFVPKTIPTLPFESMKGMNYSAIAQKILSVFLPEYSSDFLQSAIQKSYGALFSNNPGAVSEVDSGLFALELWHGPTAAFKDYALQLMPHLLTGAKQINNEKTETVVLVATSGDTGKAALEGFRDLSGIKIVVFYPEEGTSQIQKLQMVTQEGSNVDVIAVQGNFDDAQRAVKSCFSDQDINRYLSQKNIRLSSANSINWGRLVPQIVYYVSSYLALCEKEKISYGDLVDYCVPTGNFGDILAGYYAKTMGLPIGKLICASNQNCVLTDFINTGVYDIRRPFFKTTSPSMDILISSNLERLLYHAVGNDKIVRTWMLQLASEGIFKVDDTTLAIIQETFEAGWADETTSHKKIQDLYNDNGYLCDPHTAVAFEVLQKQQKIRVPTIVVSTASPFKFCESVLGSLEIQIPTDVFQAMDALAAYTGCTPPESLLSIRDKSIRFSESIVPEDILKFPYLL